MNNLDKVAKPIDGASLIEYLQMVAGLDTNREGDVVKIQIAVHPDFALVVMPLDEEPAYFQLDLGDDFGQDPMPYRVEPPKED